MPLGARGGGGGGGKGGARQAGWPGFSCVLLPEAPRPTSHLGGVDHLLGDLIVFVTGEPRAVLSALGGGGLTAEPALPPVGPPHRADASPRHIASSSAHAVSAKSAQPPRSRASGGRGHSGSLGRGPGKVREGHLVPVKVLWPESAILTQGHRGLLCVPRGHRRARAHPRSHVVPAGRGRGRRAECPEAPSPGKEGG